MRRFMDRYFRTDADLNAFFIDYFPEVKRQLDTGTQRSQKLNLLFEMKSDREIYDALRNHARAALDKFIAEDAQQGPEAPVPPAPAGIDRKRVFAVLAGMLESQFHQVVLFSNAPRAHLPSQSASIAQQATQLIAWFEPRPGGLAPLVDAIRQVDPDLL